MGVKYKVILGFDIVAIDVADAEKEVDILLADASSLDDLKGELFLLTVEEVSYGVEKDKPKS